MRHVEKRQHAGAFKDSGVRNLLAVLEVRCLAAWVKGLSEGVGSVPDVVFRLHFSNEPRCGNLACLYPRTALPSTVPVPRQGGKGDISELVLGGPRCAGLVATELLDRGA